MTATSKRTPPKEDSCGLCGLFSLRRQWSLLEVFFAAGISVALTYIFLQSRIPVPGDALTGYNTSDMHVVRRVNGWHEFDMMVVTDLDTESKEKSGKKWHSNARRGVLKVKDDGKAVNVEWEKEDFVLSSQLASGGRAMELSDLAIFDGHLVTVDDRTGILYRIQNNQMLPWVLLNDGPGNTTKTLKGEWMTVKDNLLYVGGLGKEWTTTTGEYVNDNPMWIKVVDRNGAVEHRPWRDVFVNVRRALGIEYPGYMIHEAVQWSPIHRKWFFLPRRASKETYSEEADEIRGTNTLIIVDEDFTTFTPVHIGDVEDPRRGFCGFQFIPNTDDNLIVALKSAEKDGIPLASYITVFDIHGNVLLKDQSMHEAHKFEGIAFA